MGMIDWAREELERAGAFDPNGDYGGMLGESVLKMVRVFAEEGHSGYSAKLALAMFERLADWQPLTPLTGGDGEWNEVSDGVWQNRRCSRVFKETDGRAYDIEGRIFREPNGACFTNRESRVYVTFPYLPTREYVDVPGEE